MAIADGGRSAGARWTLTALLRRLQPAPRPRRIAPITVALPADRTIADVAEVRPRKKRHYPQQRDSFLETSSMAREMYRL